MHTFILMAMPLGAIWGSNSWAIMSIILCWTHAAFIPFYYILIFLDFPKIWHGIQSLVQGQCNVWTVGVRDLTANPVFSHSYSWLHPFKDLNPMVWWIAHQRLAAHYSNSVLAWLLNLCLGLGEAFVVLEQCLLLVLHCTLTGDYMAEVGIVVHGCALLFKWNPIVGWQRVINNEDIACVPACMCVYVCPACLSLDSAMQQAFQN